MKKEPSALLIALVCTVILCVGAYFGWSGWNKTFILHGTQPIRRDATELVLVDQAPDPTLLSQLQLAKLDITGCRISFDEYARLCQSLPQCEIIWSVPFQGEYIPSDSTSLTIPRFTQEDAELIQFFPKLTTIDATACSANDALLQIRTTQKLQVDYSVTVGEKELAVDTTEVTLENVNADELAAALPHFLNLKTVTLTGDLPSQEILCAWKAEYPDTTFVWDFTVCGVPTNSLRTELILNDIPMESTETVENALNAFYGLKKVEMCRCGISNEDMWALRQRHPEVLFVWTVQVGIAEVRTDITTFMPYKLGYVKGWFFDQYAANLRYCTELVVLDLGHMRITDYSFMEHMTKLEYLILAQTRGTDFSVLAKLESLKYLELFITKFDQAEVLTGLKNLEDLNIGTTPLDNIEPLKEMTWLKNLWLPTTPNISADEQQQLIAALPDTQICFAGFGSTDLGWREVPNYFAMRDLLGMDYRPGIPK